ncbi:hypothetical protein ADJ77_02660 [Prevotella fusca JCM 17724]|uniref:Uncharacterized protein n=1 Tax=Prevotella fusca JCM 17724 TaxID=1236517 RepID=A0A0K1NI25_9BACT|nr:hypothetical protein ADJ77_02660 [Prevotella fusca JCM 17724]
MQVFDSLQVTTLLKPVIFVLLFEPDSRTIVKIFQMHFFRISQGKANRRTVADIDKRSIVTMIWI